MCVSVFLMFLNKSAHLYFCDTKTPCVYKKLLCHSILNISSSICHFERAHVTHCKVNWPLIILSFIVTNPKPMKCFYGPFWINEYINLVILLAYFLLVALDLEMHRVRYNLLCHLWLIRQRSFQSYQYCWAFRWGYCWWGFVKSHAS